MDQKILEVCRKNRHSTVESMKEVRKMTGLGFFEAKKIVEDAFDEIDNTPIIPTNNSIENIKLQHKFVGDSQLTYKGGHPDLTAERKCTLSIYTDLVEVNCGFSKTKIPMNQVGNCQFETQDQIERRYTATRILALGVFALAFKKKKKTTDKYLTIDYTDDNGISNTILFEGKGCQQAHSAMYRALSSYKVNSASQLEGQTSSSKIDPYEEVKKAKELLELEIITQEEFDQKKKELLGL